MTQSGTGFGRFRPVGTCTNVYVVPIREAVLEEPAVEVAQHLLVDEASRDAKPLLVPLLPLSPDLVGVNVEEGTTQPPSANQVRKCVRGTYQYLSRIKIMSGVLVIPTMGDDLQMWRMTASR